MTANTESTDTAARSGKSTIGCIIRCSVIAWSGRPTRGSVMVFMTAPDCNRRAARALADFLEDSSTHGRRGAGGAGASEETTGWKVRPSEGPHVPSLRGPGRAGSLPVVSGILVTGSAGHLGEALALTLREAGREVRGIDRRPSAFTDAVGSIVDRPFV